jgi:site-specific recombinase XerC
MSHRNVRQIMYNEVKVVLSEDLSKRGYLTFYIDGNRYREYNGSKLNLNITPNLFRTYKERLSQFKKLAFEFTKAIDKGWNPVELKAEKEFPTLQIALKEILNEKLNSDLSKLYKRDLNTIYSTLVDYFPENLLKTQVTKVKEIDIESFLNQYKSSGTYYMSKRKTTNVFFSELVRKKLLTENPVKDTRPMKRIAKLHQVYDKKQLKDVLEFLLKEYPNLHFCCLLTYGCFLRPHQEIRLLKKRHVNDDINKIVLAASENKSRRVRTTMIPAYVKDFLKLKLAEISDPEVNLLSNQIEPYNDSYINTQWSRAKKRMIELGILEEGHTIYSFRHTAAVNVYRKTKDLHILQQLLQHSNMIVTLSYLRGLGELDEEKLKDSLPEL